MLEKSLESPLDSKKIKPVNYKGNQSWIFIGRTDAEAPILWSPDAKSWLIRKDPDAGKDWRQEKGMTEVVMVGWHDWLNGHGWAPGDGEGQGGQACCSLWFCKELDMTEWQNNQYKLSYFPLCFTRAFCFIWITFLKWIWRLCCASSCLTLQSQRCPSGSSVHGDFPGKNTRVGSQPRDQTQVSHIAGRFFEVWATSQISHFVFLLHFTLFA